MHFVTVQINAAFFIIIKKNSDPTDNNTYINIAVVIVIIINIIVYFILQKNSKITSIYECWWSFYFGRNLLFADNSRFINDSH